MGQPILEAKGDIITSGLHPGRGNSAIPLWAQGSNVVFKDGSVKPGPAQSLLFNKSSGLVGNGIRAVDNDGSAALVWGNKRRLYRGTDIPTANDATRASNVINDMDMDSTNWTGVDCTLSDEAIIVAPGGTGGSLKADGAGTGPKMITKRNLAAGATDFRGSVFSVWLQANSNAFDKMNLGNSIQIRISSVSGGATDYFEYHFSRALLGVADVWEQIILDIDVETPDDSNGTVDLENILHIQLSVQVALANFEVGDSVYWDELAFEGDYNGTDLDTWSIVQFGQSVLATNGVDEVQYLADITTGLFQNISAAGGDLAVSFRAHILQKLGPFIIAFNTDNDNTEARWCSEDNVLLWTPIASNSARDVQIRDMNSNIEAVVEFGNSLLVMGSKRAHIFQFLGAPLFFGAQKLIDGVGAVSKNALTEGGTLIYGFSPHGLFLTDGSQKQYIDQPDIHKFIFEGPNKYDKTRKALVCVWEDATDNEIYFSYPTVDGFGFTVSFSPQLQVWSMHDYWRTAASTGELWDAPVMVDNDGDIWIQSDAGSGSVQDVNPLGLSDLSVLTTAFGHPAFGQNGFGGIGNLE